MRWLVCGSGPVPAFATCSHKVHKNSNLQRDRAEHFNSDAADKRSDHRTNKITMEDLPIVGMNFEVSIRLGEVRLVWIRVAVV